MKDLEEALRDGEDFLMTHDDHEDQTSNNPEDNNCLTESVAGQGNIGS